MLYGHTSTEWIVFHLIVFLLLVLDLGVFNRKTHVIALKEALGWSVFWIAVAASFGGYLHFQNGAAQSIPYFTGYLVEKSLSVDNLFVFAVIFKMYNVERKFQHKLLFWGIIGAILFRGGMIVLGTELLSRFHWVLYVFGVFLVYTGIGLYAEKKETSNFQNSKLARWAHRYLKISNVEPQGRFFVRENKVWYATTFFLALLVVEISDVIFALDSVPAVMGVTRDPYLVYTSNIFAILGLRSLFFVLEELLDRFHFLSKGLAFILVFVGTKMLVEPWVELSNTASLLVIGSMLVFSAVLSLIVPVKK